MRLWRANLAGWLVATTSASGWAGTYRADEVDPPRRVAFRLADGVRINGEITEWDRDSFDGSFGRRLWTELMPDDAWRLHRTIMDDSSAAHWIGLGRLFLQFDGEEARAENAFKQALKCDASAGEAIEAVRAEVREMQERQSQSDDAVRGEAMETLSPEAREWPTDHWPVPSAQEQAAARLSVIADAERILQQSGMTIDPVESDFFLLYTDAPREDAARWAVGLDAQYRELAVTMGLDGDSNVFWGRAVVLLFLEQDQFRLVEAAAFNQFVSLDTHAITHFSGPKAFIIAHRQKDTVLLRATLAHEMVHAFMHRFHSPRRLPPWANEGLAELFAQRVIDASIVHEGIRRAGLDMIRAGYRTAGLLTMQYSDGSFPGARLAGYSIGHLMVEYLLRRNPAAFIAWVKSVKSGFAWDEALTQHFGGSVQDFIASFEAFYRVND